MEKRPNRPGLLERTADFLDLPADAIAGLPRLELIGSRELRIENHRGILACGEEEICVSGGAFLIQITGTELKLRAMTGLELLVTGEIGQIRLN